MPGFARQGAALECDGHSLEDAAARFDTPLYVYSKAALVGAYRAYESAFAAQPHRICYAVKANGSGALLRILAELGAGADVVSGGELRAALRAGFAADRLVFSGVGKTDAEIRAGVAAGATFNAESEDEIRRISAAASAAGHTLRVALRVNPDIDARAHPYVATGLRESKFGVEIARAPELLRRARAWPGIGIVGVHSHIGSQITDLAPLAEAARALAELSRRLLAEGFPLTTIDIGGGLGVDYEDARVPGPAALAQAVLPHVRGLPLTLLLEPGRSLVARAGVLLTRVLEVKESGGARRFVVVDAGMNDLLRPALYAAYHRIEPVVLGERATWRADVVGPVCETGDFLARDRELPRVVPGDLLAVADAGAYGFSMSSNYNLRPRAAEALVDEAGVRLVRRRETFDDLVAAELE